MGNVNASSSASSQPPNQVPTPLPSYPDLPPMDDKQHHQKDSKDKLELNPGPLMELHKNFKDMLPNTFEGARFQVLKPLSSFFSVTHTFTLNKSDSGYNFGTTYADADLGATEANYILSSEIDPNFNLTGQIFYKFSDKTRGKAQVMCKNQMTVLNEASLEYRGESSTTTVALVQPDILGMNGILLGQYFQTVASGISLGAEIVHQKFRPQTLTILSLAAKYQPNPQTLISAKVGSRGVSASYYTKKDENFKIGAEVDTDFFQQESVATVAYEVDVPQSNLQFKGMVNSKFIVGATLEKKLHPLPFVLTLSGQIDHVKNNFQFGCGMSIGSP